jgi:branched-chain amino acid transport system ATP-binding protein
MLQVNQVSTGYGEIQIVWDVSFEINEGEIVALVGANGAGKSSLIKTIAGILPCWSGDIRFEGHKVGNLPVPKVITLGIALVPEGRRLFPYMTVLENLEMGAYTETSKQKMADNLAWVYDLFPRLKERAKQLAGTLSGGEQQMVTIGRALMSKPKFLMMDEPSLGLAPLVVDNVFETVKKLQAEGVTILLVEQNVRKSLEIAHRGYVLEHGRIVMSGDSQSLVEDENIRKAYLGI